MSCIFVVPKTYTGIILRLGKPDRLIKPGFNIMICLIDRPIRIRVEDVPELKTAGTDEVRKAVLFNYVKDKKLDKRKGL